jgi:hypothetical protein
MTTDPTTAPTWQWRALTHNELTPRATTAEKVTNDTGDAGQMGLQW